MQGKDSSSSKSEISTGNFQLEISSKKHKFSKFVLFILIKKFPSRLDATFYQTFSHCFQNKFKSIPQSRLPSATISFHIFYKLFRIIREAWIMQIRITLQYSVPYYGQSTTLTVPTRPTEISTWSFTFYKNHQLKNHRYFALCLYL